MVCTTLLPSAQTQHDVHATLLRGWWRKHWQRGVVADLVQAWRDAARERRGAVQDASVLRLPLPPVPPSRKLCPAQRERDALTAASATGAFHAFYVASVRKLLQPHGFRVELHPPGRPKELHLFARHAAWALLSGAGQGVRAAGEGAVQAAGTQAVAAKEEAADAASLPAASLLRLAQGRCRQRAFSAFRRILRAVPPPPPASRNRRYSDTTTSETGSSDCDEASDSEGESLL